MQTTVPRLTFASDHSILVTFGESIHIDHHRSVMRITHRLLADRHPAFLNVHPAYASVLISFSPQRLPAAEAKRLVSELIEGLETIPLPEGRTVVIPVCYGGELGPDLDAVASHNRLSPEEVVALHSSGEYLVYFLGFSPGFPYMGGMSKKLATPRLATPRTQVPAGSVAIGGSQTGIYPIASPGGWRIIGRTPLRLFHPQMHPPAYLQMGDIVRFKPIDRDEFERLLAE